MQRRREFLKTLLGGSSMLLVAACAGGSSVPASGAVPTAPRTTAAPVNSGASVSLLQWNHFIPRADQFFKKQAAEWGQQTGVDVRI